MAPRIGRSVIVKRPRLRIFASSFALLLAIGGCGGNRAPGSDWPEGTLVVARTEALARLLARLQRLEGTRLARRAAALAGALPDCEWVEGREEEGRPSDVWSRLSCRATDSALAGLDRERGDRDLAFALPKNGGARTLGTLAIAEDGAVDAEVLLPRSAFAGTWALTLPGAEPPGPTLLSHADELVHARLRPEGGLNIAALVPESSQADRMFRLKSELFAGAVLDGTWEAAIYLPEPGHPMPRSALAVGFSFRGPAIAAMERFVNDLQATWPVRRSDFAVGAAQGACLLDLTLLPDLAPCYVATEGALVVGWNPASVRKALAKGEKGGGARGALRPRGGLTVDLDRFPDADARFAQLASPDASPAPVVVYPWRRLTADGVRDGDAVRVHVHLAGGAGA
jgi:hypothetical protein